MNRISIITICFNNLEELKQTCESVEKQQELPYEHIIIDGSTNSNINNWLTGSPQPPIRKWIFERDKGIADAFNKGISIANGEIIVLLNSGDMFFDSEVLSNVSKRFLIDADLMWLHGKYKIKRGGEWVIIGKIFEAKKLYRGMRSLCHQTMFVKKELYSKFGVYNKDLKIAMDYDFVIRIRYEKFSFINTPLVSFAPDGTSSINYYRSLEEARLVYFKYFGRSVKLQLWQLRLKILHYLLHSPIGNSLYFIKRKLNLANW